MDQEQELDLVVFTDDEGNEVTMEVLDYFFYEGNEYALLTEYDEEAECEHEGCDHESCDCCGHHDQDAYIMQVVPVGDDQEEFVPVDETLMDRLVEFVQNELYSDEDMDEEDPEEEE